jgi:hypothetical protein
VDDVSLKKTPTNTHIDIDKVIDVIERIREPLDQRDRENQIIRSEYVLHAPPAQLQD